MNKQLPYIIAIEGIDKSGKHTLAKGLVETFEAKGYTVEHSEFHRYDTPTGELIARYLKKEIELSDDAIELIMAADKINQLDYIRNCESDILILDRYLLSQYAYAEAKNRLGMTTATAYKLHKVLEDMPKADVTIILTLDPKVSMARKGKHGDNDRYESDIRLLQAVNQAMHDLPRHLYSRKNVQINLKETDTPEMVEAAFHSYFDEVLVRKGDVTQ